jgi:membrane protein implicated in regulation of membrane protease activity
MGLLVLMLPMLMVMSALVIVAAMIMGMTGLGPAWLMSASFVTLPGAAIVLVHNGKPRRRDDARSRNAAYRAGRRHIAFAYPPQFGEWTAVRTFIFV